MNVLDWWQGTQQFQVMWCSRNLQTGFTTSWQWFVSTIYCSDIFPKEVDCNFKFTMQFHTDYKGVAWISRLFCHHLLLDPDCWLPPCAVVIHTPSYPLASACFSQNQRTEEKKIPWESLCHEVKMDPGLHPKQCGQQVKGSVSPPLLHSHDTPHGVQNPDLEPPSTGMMGTCWSQSRREKKKIIRGLQQLF